MVGQAQKLCVPCITHERDVRLGVRRIRRDLKEGIVTCGNELRLGAKFDVLIEEGIGAGAS